MTPASVSSFAFTNTMNRIVVSLAPPQSPVIPGVSTMIEWTGAKSTGRPRTIGAARRRGDVMRDWEAFNRGVVEHFRAHGGVGPGRWADRPLLVLTTTGAKSGQPRSTPLLYSTDGDRLVVIASKGGEPTNPDWYHNLLAHAEATVEVGGERFPVRASIAAG